MALVGLVRGSGSGKHGANTTSCKQGPSGNLINYVLQYNEY